MLKRILYKKIVKKLLKFFKKLLGRKPKGHFRSRIRSLAAYMVGMIRNKSSHLSALGKGLIQFIKGDSRAKAARKFVYNQAVDYRTYYLPYMQELVRMILSVVPDKEAVYLAIDGSQMGKHHAILMISLVYGKRSIPIGWHVKKGAKGHFSKANHVALIEQVQADLAGVVPVTKKVVLLGDGEFGSIELQQCCLSNHWSYVFRIACNTVLFKEEEWFKPKGLGLTKVRDYVWIRSEQMAQMEESYLDELLFTATSEWELPEESALIPGQNHLLIEEVEFSLKRFKGVHFLLWHDPKCKKPLPLISNETDAEFITQAYEKRWAVECLFKDLKSTSFKLDKTRLTCAEAIHNLVMIAAFAFTLVFNLGKLYKDHPIRGYIHQVRKDQVVCSTFNLGQQLINLFLEEGIDFCFDQVVPIPIAELKQIQPAY